MSFQFKYNSLTEIRAVSIQGSGLYSVDVGDDEVADYYITAFYISYTLDNIHWRLISNADYRARVCTL